VVLKSVLSKVIARYIVRFMLQIPLDQEAVKVGVRQLENFHLMQCKARICLALT